MTQPMPPMPPQQQNLLPDCPPQGYSPPEKKPHTGLKILLGIVIGLVIIVVAISIFFLTVLKKGVDEAEEVGLINTETHNGVIGEPVACGINLEMTVYSAGEDTNDYALSPADGYYFLTLDLGFVNNGKYSEPLDPTLEMRIKDSEGRLYGHVNVGPEPLLPGGDIKGRTNVGGYVVFVVPRTANGLVFQFEPWQPFGDTALITLD